MVKVEICELLVDPTGWLLKVREEGKKLTTGITPVPLRLAVCGLPVALSVMLSWPVARPGVVGSKVTVKVQFAPAFTLEPHVLV